MISRYRTCRLKGVACLSEQHSLGSKTGSDNNDTACVRADVVYWMTSIFYEMARHRMGGGR